MATTQQQMQYDVLWLTTETNPLLPTSPVPTINKSLATNAKQVIKAINEIFKNNQGTQSSVDSFINNFNTFVALIGDTYADSTLSPKLDAIGDNVILALDALSTAIKNLSDTIADKADTSTTNAIAEAITQINQSISNINSAIESGAIGSGGTENMVTKTINLGVVTIPYSSTSVYTRVAFVAIPEAIKSEIDFTKRLRVQIYRAYTDSGYAKKFNTLICDTDFNDTSYEIGYTLDYNYFAIYNKTSASFVSPQVNLIYYPKEI